jgi:hypothetical protein
MCIYIIYTCPYPFWLKSAATVLLQGCFLCMEDYEFSDLDDLDDILCESDDDLPDELPLSPELIIDDVLDAPAEVLTETIDVSSASTISDNVVLRLVPLAKPKVRPASAKPKGRPAIPRTLKVRPHRIVPNQLSSGNPLSLANYSWEVGVPIAALHTTANICSSASLVVPVSVRGLAPLPIGLMHAVCASADLAAAQRDEIFDEDIHKAVSHFVSRLQMPFASYIALSELLTLPQRTIQTCLLRSAVALQMFCLSQCVRAQRSLFESIPRQDLCELIECVQYDETPLPTRVPGDAPANSELSNFKPKPVLALADASSNSVVCQIGATKTLQVFASQAPQKVVQGRGDIGMVVRLGTKMVTITMHLVADLGLVERTTAVNLKKLLLSWSRIDRCRVGPNTHTHTRKHSP